jgi:hypothetical protein
MHGRRPCIGTQSRGRTSQSSIGGCRFASRSGRLAAAISGAAATPGQRILRDPVSRTQRPHRSVITSLAAPTADRILCARKVGPSRRRRRSAAAPERPLRAPSAVPRARLTANAERTCAGAAPTLAVPSRGVPRSSAAASLMVVSPLLGRRSLRTYDVSGAVMPRLRCQRDGK